MQTEPSLRKASALAPNSAQSSIKRTLESVEQYLWQQQKTRQKGSEFNPVEPYYFNTE